LKKRNVLKSGVLSLAVLAWATFAPSASAAVVGTLNVANCGSGGVTVTALSIDWLPTGGGTGCILVGTNSPGTPYVTFSGGNVAPGETGTIKDLVFASTPGNAFMVFTGVGGGAGTISFDLAGLGPGSTTACTSGMALFASCSVGGTGPFLLTRTGTSTTSVSLVAFGTVSDGTLPISNWNGSYSTQFNLAPIDIQNFIMGVADSNTGFGCSEPGGAAPGSCTNTYSGTFAVVVGPTVPEPGSMFLIGAGLVGLASLRRRKKQSV
jgi:PEP-CTERM motif